ncbi:hypothetical protein LEN26_010150 [Aphanomyces euteiches]|nr:hypothetical protein LEN26_010150 [Aphanomyces euteiches]
MHLPLTQRQAIMRFLISCVRVATDINEVGIKHIAKLKFIQVLDISRCDVLTDASLHIVRRTLSHLTELHINECRNFSQDVIISTWVDCTRLHKLYAQGCHGVTDRVLLCIATTKRAVEYSLQVLDVRQCRNVTDAGIAEIANAKQEFALHWLGFSNCFQVHSMAFFSFENNQSLKQLQTLEVAGLDLDETAMSWLTLGCVNLTKINLAHCSKVTDYCLLLLARCSNLRWLSLKGCSQVSTAGLRHFVGENQSSSLAYLNLKNCVLIDDAGINVIAQACLDLEQLNLRGVPHVTDNGMRALARRCTILRTLKLSGCRNPAFYGRPNIGDDGLRALSMLCRRLAVLDLAGAPRVTSQGIAAIATTCHELLNVNLSDTAINDMAILALAANCTLLQVLQLSKCQGITDSAIEAIANSLFNLRTLGLAYCKQLTDSALVALAATKLSLQTLDMTGNERITDNGLVALAKGCQMLRTLQLKGKILRACIRETTSKTLPFCLEYNTTPWIAVYERFIEQYDAAVRLQALYRRWKQRGATIQAMAKRKWRRSRRAAIKIQRSYRRHYQWRSFLHFLSVGRNLQLVCHVQAVFRGNQSRAKTREWRKLANKSAACIQRLIKRHLFRRHGHAREIQRMYRGYRGRQEAKALRQLKRDHAGIKIVQWARRCLARAAFHKRAQIISGHVRRIQRTFRSYARREHIRALVRRYIACATRIQSMVRMVAAKIYVKQRRILLHKCAQQIQTIYRGYRVRRWYRQFKTKIVAAAIRVQAWRRTIVGRRLFCHVRTCVTAAQRRVRTYLAVRLMHLLAMRALEHRRLESTKLIQRVWRGHMGRRRATLFRKIQRAKFAKKGQTTAGFFMRRQLLRRGAAVLIQRWFRPIRQRIRMGLIHTWRVQQAQLCIQRYVRGWIARVRATCAAMRLVDAAQDIQRVFRGHMGRSRVRSIRRALRQVRAAVYFQSLFRGFLARQYAKRYRRESSRAALTIQRIYRGKLGRRLGAIERAKRTLVARDKYKASIRGKLDLSVEPRERKFFLKRQIALMQVSFKQLERRRVGYEKKMQEVRANRDKMWSRTNQVVAETFKLQRHLVGASENVFVTKREMDADLERRDELNARLLTIHVNMTRFKAALREKIQEVRVMDPDEFWAIAGRTAIFDALQQA